MPNSATVFIDLREVSRRIGLGKSAIYCLIRTGRFPRAVRLTSKAVRWDAAEVDRWQRDRLAERDRAA